MTFAWTIFTEVVFVEQIFVRILIIEFREKLTYSLVAVTTSQMEVRRDEEWMAGRMEYRKLPPHKVFLLNFVQEAENRYWCSIQGEIHHKISQNNQRF